jgi:hypothetical protein
MQQEGWAWVEPTWATMAKSAADDVGVGQVVARRVDPLVGSAAAQGAVDHQQAPEGIWWPTPRSQTADSSGVLTRATRTTATSELPTIHGSRDRGSPLG